MTKKKLAIVQAVNISLTLKHVFKLTRDVLNINSAVPYYTDLSGTSALHVCKLTLERQHATLVVVHYRQQDIFLHFSRSELNLTVSSYEVLAINRCSVCVYKTFLLLFDFLKLVLFIICGCNLGKNVQKNN